jgi:pilus assembly protein Flp/PilA
MSIYGFMQSSCVDERGATAIEYGLILSLVVIAIIGSLSAFADETTGMWNDIEQKSRDAMQQD